MKKIITLMVVFGFSLLLLGCSFNKDNNPGNLDKAELDVLYKEQRDSFNFFWETTNHQEGSKGYGLARDRYPGNTEIASIAAVGYALSSYVIGVEEGWITKEEGFERTNKTFDTLLSMDRIEGFYFHFINIYTGKREWNSEVSVIDTAILLMGGISAAEYFGGETKTKLQEIYDEVNWPWYLDNRTKMFRMGYSPETGFSGYWDNMSEQLMMYVLASGSSTNSISKEAYDKIMAISKSDYTGKYISTKNPHLSVNENFIYSFNGSLFQHQFTQSFIDFRNLEDRNGINWHHNATLATKANYAFVQDNSDRYKTYSEYSWGLSASDGPGEYNAYGARPSKSNVHNGTIAPYAALASINYLPEIVGKTALHFSKVEGLVGQYGFYDAYNLGPVDPQYNQNIANKTPWIAPDYIGIDKGVTLNMISNYKNGIIWRMVMKNDNIQAGLTILGILNV